MHISLAVGEQGTIFLMCSNYACAGTYQITAALLYLWLDTLFQCSVCGRKSSYKKNGFATLLCYLKTIAVNLMEKNSPLYLSCPSNK